MEIKLKNFRGAVDMSTINFFVLCHKIRDEGKDWRKKTRDYPWWADIRVSRPEGRHRSCKGSHEDSVSRSRRYSSTPSGAGSEIDVDRSKGLARQASGYILNIIHYFQKLRAQTRLLSSLYGVINRLARLATEAGEYDATLALYTLIPLRDRRRAPWAILTKYLADCTVVDNSSPFGGIEGRPDLCLLLMRAEGQKERSQRRHVAVIPAHNHLQHAHSFQPTRGR